MRNTIEIDPESLAEAYLIGVALYLLYRLVTAQERQARAQERQASDIRHVRRDTVGTLPHEGEVPRPTKTEPATLDLDDEEGDDA